MKLLEKGITNIDVEIQCGEGLIEKLYTIPSEIFNRNKKVILDYINNYCDVLDGEAVDFKITEYTQPKGAEIPTVFYVIVNDIRAGNTDEFKLESILPVEDFIELQDNIKELLNLDY